MLAVSPETDHMIAMCSLAIWSYRKLPFQSGIRLYVFINNGFYGLVS